MPIPEAGVKCRPESADYSAAYAGSGTLGDYYRAIGKIKWDGFEMGDASSLGTGPA